MSLLRPASRRWRHTAMIGGSTTWGDALLAARYALRPAAAEQIPVLRAYEDAFAEVVGAREAVSFASGRVALLALLRGLGVGPGDEVLVPVPTHVVVPNAVTYCGAVPVFVDCTYDTLGMDVELARQACTSRTRALLLQHTFGIPADVEAALELGRERGIAVLEDCVHALGARHHGRPVGALATAGFFSTEETKTVSTTMGGMAVTDDPVLADRLRRVQQECAAPAAGLVRRYLAKLVLYHVATAPRVHRASRLLYEALGRPQPLPRATSPAERRAALPPGHLQRLSAAQAAVGLRQLHRLARDLEHRRAVARLYTDAVRGAGGQHPRPLPGDEASWLRFPVWVSDLARAEALLRDDVVPGTWFTSVLEEAADPGAVGYVAGSCPRAEAAIGRLVNLPTHSRVSRADAEAAVRAVVPALSRQAPSVAAPSEASRTA